jgi:hypothetical protein
MGDFQTERSPKAVDILSLRILSYRDYLPASHLETAYSSTIQPRGTLVKVSIHYVQLYEVLYMLVTLVRAQGIIPRVPSVVAMMKTPNLSSSQVYWTCLQVFFA